MFKSYKPTEVSVFVDGFSIYIYTLQEDNNVDTIMTEAQQREAYTLPRRTILSACMEFLSGSGFEPPKLY